MKSCEKQNQKAGFDLHGMITITACRMLKKFGIPKPTFDKTQMIIDK